MKRDKVIQEAINRLGAQTYLEIGVEKGKNFFLIKAPQKFAVDPKFRIKLKLKLQHFLDYRKSLFFERTSDDFFTYDAPSVLKARTIDLAFIDGLHTFEQSLRDFDNCLKYLTEGGLILLHDCNPLTPEAAAPASSIQGMYNEFPDRKSNDWNGDVWKTILYLQTRPDLEVFVLDCDHGVGVVRKVTENPTKLNYSRQDIDNFTYQDFDSNRAKFLNLKSPTHFADFLKTVDSIR
jgi:hypothetical protein